MFDRVFFNIQSTPKTLFLKSTFFANTHPTLLKGYLYNPQDARQHWKKNYHRELVGFLSLLRSTDCVDSGAPLVHKLDHSLLHYPTLPTVAIECAVGVPRFSKVEVAVGIGYFDLRIDPSNMLSHSVLVRIHIDSCSILYTPLVYRKHKTNRESRGFGFSREGLTINSEIVAEPMLLDSEDDNSPAAPTPSPATSVQSTADEWWNADTIVGQEPLSLLATPNIGQEDLRWSTQVLAQLPSYDKDTVFRTEPITTPTHGKARALHHDQPHKERHGQVLSSSYNQAPRPRHNQVLGAVSGSDQTPMAGTNPTQFSRSVPRPSELLRTSKDPTAADIRAWLQSVDDALPDDLTPPADPTDWHSARSEQITPTPPRFWVPETAAHSQDTPCPYDRMALRKQGKEGLSTPSSSSCLPSRVTVSENSSPFPDNKVAWERTRFFHASQTPS